MTNGPSLVPILVGGPTRLTGQGILGIEQLALMTMSVPSMDVLLCTKRVAIAAGII